ncbi:MAG: hypothetical protein ACYCUI_14000 [Vulcanimicrobiaceae bacterium]
MNKTACAPQAWLHTITQGDGETDQALSFSPDSFPFDGTAGYRSVSHVPLYDLDVAIAPDGWQLVPIAPTPQMVQAACDLCCPEGVGARLESGRLQHSPALMSALVKSYTAMLKAAKSGS